MSERRIDGLARPRGRAPTPTCPYRITAAFYADMAALLQQDLANVAAGIYPLPSDHDGSLLTLLNRSGLFFEALALPMSKSQCGD